jgi:hypothetical protein
LCRPVSGFSGSSLFRPAAQISRSPGRRDWGSTPRRWRCLRDRRWPLQPAIRRKKCIVFIVLKTLRVITYICICRHMYTNFVWATIMWKIIKIRRKRQICEKRPYCSPTRF